MKIKKLLAAVLLFSLVLTNCAGLSQQTLPDDRPLGVRINNVTFRVLSVGHARDFTRIEIAVANQTGEPLVFDPRQVYMTSDKGYDMPPLPAVVVQNPVKSETGQWVAPLAVTALVAGIAAVIMPSSHDRAGMARAALALLIASMAADAASGHSGYERYYDREDLVLKNYRIPPNLQLGGALYFPPVKHVKTVKAFIAIKGTEEFFPVDL